MTLIWSYKNYANKPQMNCKCQTLSHKKVGIYRFTLDTVATNMSKSVGDDIQTDGETRQTI